MLNTEEVIKDKEIKFYFVADLNAKSLHAATNNNKVVIIYIPIGIMDMTMKNSVFQEQIREILIHELTHVFDNTKRVRHRPVGDTKMTIVNAQELDYFIDSKEILAYSVQAARYARRNKLNFVDALKHILKRANKNIRPIVIQTYLKKLKTNKELYKRFKNLLKGKEENPLEN